MDKEELRLLQSLNDKVDNLYFAIVGDLVDEGKPGLLRRVDRVERTIKNVKRGLWIVFGSVITIIVKALS